jgi:hypothetical protein
MGRPKKKSHLQQKKEKQKNLWKVPETANHPQISSQLRQGNKKLDGRSGEVVQ